jgi:hypothetical protein
VLRLQPLGHLSRKFQIIIYLHLTFPVKRLADLAVNPSPPESISPGLRASARSFTPNPKSKIPRTKTYRPTNNCCFACVKRAAVDILRAG